MDLNTLRQSFQGRLRTDAADMAAFLTDRRWKWTGRTIALAQPDHTERVAAVDPNTPPSFWRSRPPSIPWCTTRWWPARDPSRPNMAGACCGATNRRGTSRPSISG